MNNSLRILLCALASLWLLASARAYAQSEPVLPESAKGARLRRLRLQEALHIAITNNLGIAMQRQQRAIGRAAVSASEGTFEPRVTSDYSYSDSITPPQSVLDGMAGDVFSSHNQRWSMAISKPLTTGTNLSVNFLGSRNSTSLGSAVSPLLYDSSLSLSIDQPLLRGFSLDRDIPRANILRAEFADRKTLEEQRIVMAREVRRAENAYWDLVQATLSYGVQDASLELAKEQLALTQRQIDAGILAPADLIGAESTVADRELSLVQSEASLSAAMDTLRSALNLPTAEWSEFLLAVDMPKVDDDVPSLEQATSDALELRPELKQYALDKERAELDLRVARNERLPELDVGFRYGVVGQDNVYRGTLSQLESLGARSWGVFVNLTWMPFGQTAAANADSVRSQSEILALQREEFLNTLRSQIRGALRELETTRRRVAASEKFRALAERSLDAERKRFLNGKSRTFEVSQREDELARARTAELAAQIEYQKARSDLDLATGRLLDSKHIELGIDRR